MSGQRGSMDQLKDHSHKVLYELHQSVQALDAFLTSRRDDIGNINISADDFHQLNALMERARETAAAWEALERQGGW
jgi:DNA anti-recombination protein RmuC